MEKKEDQFVCYNLAKIIRIVALSHTATARTRLIFTGSSTLPVWI